MPEEIIQPPKPDPVTEKHFYSMPDDCELFLATVAALQDYSFWLAKRSVSVEVTVHCPNRGLEVLIPTMEREGKMRVVKVVQSLEGFTSEEYDQVVQFNPEIAYKLSLTTGKHAAQMMGIMVGSDPMKVLPDISAVTKDYNAEIDILVLPFPGSENVYEFLMNNKPELTVEHAKGQWFWYSALKGRMVVGVRSGLTYLAASAGRAVVEIYPPDVHRNWLSKWMNPQYQMICGNPGDVSPELAYRAVEAMWKKVLMKQRALAVPQNA